MSRYKTPKIEELFEAGVHFGHQVRRWHPKMEPYIYGVRKNIHIIDLEQTEELLKKACDALYEIAKKGGQIIFIGTKRQSREIIELEAKRCGAKFVTERWLGGTITNFRIIKKNVDKLVEMMQKRETGEYVKYTKREKLLIDREIEKLNKNVGGLLGLHSVPATLFVIDPRREKTAIREAKRAGISTVSIVDTNADPSNITYPIPGNDDAIKSIAIIAKAIADAIEFGYKEFSEAKEDAAQKQKEDVAPTEALADTKERALHVTLVEDEAPSAGEAVDVVKELEAPAAIVEDLAKSDDAAAEAKKESGEAVPAKKRGRPSKKS